MSGMIDDPAGWTYYLNRDHPEQPVAYGWSGGGLGRTVEVTDYGRSLGFSVDGARLVGPEPLLGAVTAVRNTPLPPRYLR